MESNGSITSLPRFSDYELADYLAFELARYYCTVTGESYFNVAVGYNPYYDLASASGNIAIEIKLDRMAMKTNNVFIETKDILHNKPSGIAATKSNLWLHAVPLKQPNSMRCYEWDVESLKLFCSDYQPVSNYAHTALGYIIPIKTFGNSATRVFDFETKFWSRIVFGSKEKEEGENGDIINPYDESPPF